MPGYIKNILHKYAHPPSKRQHAPHPYRAPVYGTKIQPATPEDELLQSTHRQEREYSK